MATGLFLVGTNAFVIAGLLPAIAAGLGTTQQTVSYTVTSYALVIAVVAPVSSALLARTSRTVLMSSGLVLMAAGTLLTAATPTVELFTLGRIIAAVGGALLVPTATAAGPAIMPPERSATAIAVITLGFSLAVAVGAPLGTAVGSAWGWRVPFAAIGTAGLALAVVIGLVVRGVPLPAPTPLRRRLAPLRDGRILAALAAGMLLLMGFNAVYLHVAAIVAPATAGEGGALSALLLVVGCFGVVGTAAAGPITDKVGAPRLLTIVIVLQVAALAAMIPAAGAFWVESIVFAVWGLTVFAGPVAVQHRLVAIEPDSAALALSWFSSVQYLGIALAPVLATAALTATGVAGLPLWAALAIGAAGVVFALAYRPPR